MVPVDSVRVPRDRTYSGILRETTNFRVRGFHPLWPALSKAVLLVSCFMTPIGKTLQPRRENPRGLGCSAFARRYLRNRFFFLLLQLLRCFSSLGWMENLGINRCLSLPPSFSQTSTLLLLTPRHPPCALSSLTT